MLRSHAPPGRFSGDFEAPAHLKPLTPVILAGGVGSRLWPLSRALFSKSFHAMFGERTLFQNTVLRALQITERPPIVVCNGESRFLVAEQLRAVDVAWQYIVLEPEGRNTAPAIALAASLAARDVDDTQLLVLPADHLIEDAAGFAAAVREAAAASASGALVAFGISPTRPETGYGYIELAKTGGQGVQPIRAFVEKPGQERAEAFSGSGRHLWNSGMFVIDAEVARAEIAAHSVDVAEAVAASLRECTSDFDFYRPGDSFLRSPSVSFDVAVMEKTSRGAVLPADFGWSDIGSWESVLERSGVDPQGNHFAGDVVPLDVTGSLIHAGHRLVGAIGVDRLIIVETADAVLVADRGRVQDVGALVERLKSTNRTEHLLHPKVFRPWGSYEGVARGERHLVKRIRVKPGAGISLQKHRHRAEHWVVVRGTAEVTREEETFTLHENESSYIPPGVKHRLDNVGEFTLEIIEVQVGRQLSEDDIVRFEDRYGRASE